MIGDIFMTEIDKEKQRAYWRKMNRKYRQNPEVRKKDDEQNKKYVRTEKYREWNRTRLKIYRKTEEYRQWQIKNRDKFRDKERIRRKDPLIRASSNFSRCLYESLRSQGLGKRGRSWEAVVGYTLDNLKQHLESLFTDNMSWDNYGRGGWHIDHIIPRSYFNFKSIHDVYFKQCWSLSNLMPCWESENLSKGAKCILT